jgi:hypothetical protein
MASEKWASSRLSSHDGLKSAREPFCNCYWYSLLRSTLSLFHGEWLYYETAGLSLPTLGKASPGSDLFSLSYGQPEKVLDRGH